MFAFDETVYKEIFFLFLRGPVFIICCKTCQKNCMLQKIPTTKEIDDLKVFLRIVRLEV